MQKELQLVRLMGEGVAATETVLHIYNLCLMRLREQLFFHACTNQQVCLPRLLFQSACEG